MCFTADGQQTVNDVFALLVCASDNMTFATFLKTTINDFFEYKTPKIVQIKNKKVGILNRYVCEHDIEV